VPIGSTPSVKKLSLGAVVAYCAKFPRHSHRLELSDAEVIQSGILPESG
jgi:hypothetical protein